MSKTENLFNQLKKANKKLEEASLDSSKGEINRDATIQRFEFVFELVWKLTQAIAGDSRETVYGPRNAIRFAAKIELINNPEKWLDYHDIRNQTAYLYSEEMAKKAYTRIKKFYKDVNEFIKRAKKHLSY